MLLTGNKFPETLCCIWSTLPQHLNQLPQSLTCRGPSLATKFDIYTDKYQGPDLYRRLLNPKPIAALWRLRWYRHRGSHRANQCSSKRSIPACSRASLPRPPPEDVARPFCENPRVP